MSLLQRLLRTLRSPRSGKITFEVDEPVLRSLQEWSRIEQRPEVDIATELLVHAAQERRLAEQRLQIWLGLSPREKEVTALGCLGYTNRQIAQRLSISPETVKTHMSNALRKFGARSKFELGSMLANWDFSAWDKGY